MRRPYSLIASIAVVGAILWWWGSLPTTTTEPMEGDSTSQSQPVSTLSKSPALERVAGWVGGSTRRTAQQWDSWLHHHSSLRGSSLDGDWGEIGPQGLAPSLALRLRFDQLMTTLGELSATELRALVSSLAERDLGSDASQVMAVWDRYVALVNTPLSSRLDLNDPQQWLMLLREQQAQRHQMLGPDWAAAFFSEEEADLIATVQRLMEYRASPQTAETPHWQAAPVGVSAETWQQQREQVLGAETAARLAALDQEESLWNQRLQMARRTWADLESRAELSQLQRDQAMRTWIDEHFEPQERVRAKALLGM